MSYSFNIRASTKTEAKEKIRTEFDKVETQYPIHSKDRAQVLATADAFIDLLESDPEKDLSVSVNGYLVAKPVDGVATAFTTASMGVSAGLLAR